MKDLIPNRAENQVLGGQNVSPTTVSAARRLIGQRVEYIRGRSGTIRTGTVTEVKGRNIEIGGDWIYLSSFVEMRLIEPPTTTGEKL